MVYSKKKILQLLKCDPSMTCRPRLVTVRHLAWNSYCPISSRSQTLRIYTRLSFDFPSCFILGMTCIGMLHVVCFQCLLISLVSNPAKVHQTRLLLS